MDLSMRQTGYDFRRFQFRFSPPTRFAEKYQAEIEASRAPLIDHLIELRQRLIRSVIAFVNRELLVLTNVGSETLRLPADLTIVHASQDLDVADDGAVHVPADTTVWARLTPVGE